MFERLAPEQHDTLDEIPEPAENPRFVGHAQAAEHLVTAYRAGKLPHALILAGPQGIGKATLAFHFAHHLLRHGDSAVSPEALASPDPASSLFRQVASGAHPGVLHLTRPLNDKTKNFKSAVTVDEVRKVGRFLSMTAHDGGWRIVIVDPADDMNVNAANALLKSLEEPPGRTMFILVAHSLGALLPTIRSRCQTVRLQPLAREEVETVLDGFDLAFPTDPVSRSALLERAAGSPRNAVLLQQYGGVDIAEALEGASRQRDITAWHKIADAVAGRDQAIAFDLFNRHALDMLANAAVEAAGANALGQAKLLSDTWQEARDAISDAETYNLDKKQHALIMIERLNAAMRM